MPIYADSSFLVSCYLPDANSAAAQSRLNESESPYFFTALQELEVRNAFELGVFRQRFTIDQAADAAKPLDGDLVNGRLIRPELRWPNVFRLASRLSKLHTLQVGTRSLDILHVASAKWLKADEFATFDIRQRSLVKLMGLDVVT